MKKRSPFYCSVVLVLCWCVTGSFPSFAQLHITGGSFFIGSGAVVAAAGDVNSTTPITGNGVLLLNGTTLQNINLNGNAVNNLQLSNSTGATLLSNVQVNNNVDFITGHFFTGNNQFIISAAATITGQGSNNYFVTDGTGALVKNNAGNSAFLFPVGADVLTYNPVTVTQNGTASNISINCLPHLLLNGSSGSGAVANAADVSWNITSSGAADNLTLQTQWIVTDELPGFTHSNAILARYVNGNGWENQPPMIVSGANPFTLIRNNIINTGIFGVLTPGAALPVEAVVLTGNWNNAGHAMLSWKVTAEVDIDQYITEHSTDGFHFSAGNAQASKGNGDHVYTDTDTSASTGINYYRIKVVHHNGNITYSNTITLQLKINKDVVSVYPLPASNLLYVKTNAAAYTLAVIYDNAGKTVATYPVHAGLNVLDIHPLPAAVYILRLYGTTGNYAQKIIVTH